MDKKEKNFKDGVRWQVFYGIEDYSPEQADTVKFTFGRLYRYGEIDQAVETAKLLFDGMVQELACREKPRRNHEKAVGGIQVLFDVSEDNPDGTMVFGIFPGLFDRHVYSKLERAYYEKDGKDL